VLLRIEFSRDNAHFEQLTDSPHSKRFPEKELVGRFKGQQIFASGTREFLKEVTDAIKQDRQLIRDGMLDMQFKNPGLLVIYDPAHHQVFAHTDLLALFPAFWTLSDNTFAISDRLVQLHSAVGGETDDVGVAEIIRLDYTIGQRTLFKNVKRLRASESLRFDWSTKKIQLKDTSRLWTHYDTSSLESVIKTGAELLTESCRQMAGTMLMMSSGWDSKTLLAGAFGAGVADRIRLYYHGAADSREARIVREQAGRFGLQLTMRQFDPALFDSKLLEDSFELYEDVSHPHWHAAGQFAAEPSSGVESVCAGIFGEIMGGHTGPPVTLKGWKKIAATFGYLSGVPILRGHAGSGGTDDARKAVTFFRESPYDRPWYMNEEVWRERFPSIHESVNADFAQAVERYVARGIGSTEAVIEAVITENRFNQIVSDQLRSAATYKPLLAPFGNRDFLEFSSSVPFEKKVHRSLNKRIIRKLFPKLLEYPTAAVLCRTSRPILLQEATRAIRRAAEDGLWSLHLRTDGKLPAPNLGWPNFQYLQHSTVLKDLIGGLRSPMWDKQRMRTFMDHYGCRNYHGLQGVMMKVKTLDLFGVA
jgi:hypothetical protein